MLHFRNHHFQVFLMSEALPWLECNEKTEEAKSSKCYLKTHHVTLCYISRGKTPQIQAPGGKRDVILPATGNTASRIWPTPRAQKAAPQKSGHQRNSEWTATRSCVSFPPQQGRPLPHRYSPAAQDTRQ